MVLATPAFRVKLYVPAAIPLLRMRHALFGRGFVKSYVKARLLTHDSQEAERYGRDPLIFRQIAVDMLLDLHDTSTRLVADAGAIHVPTLLLAAGSDWVVRLGARSEEHTSELQSQSNLVCRLLLEKKKEVEKDVELVVVDVAGKLLGPHAGREVHGALALGKILLPRVHVLLLRCRRVVVELDV